MFEGQENLNLFVDGSNFYGARNAFQGPFCRKLAQIS